MARIVGELGAEAGSRSVDKTLRVTGLVPPSRAVIAKRTTDMAVEIADEIDHLEQAARDVETVPAEVGSVSCGMDRMAVRMSEVTDPENPTPSTRTEPYERTPPPEKEHHYRMAWVGSTSIYDQQGNELHTWRYATEASADPATIARRVAKDVAWITNTHRGVPVHCVQDGASELRALPKALALTLPANKSPVELVDFEHLMGYLEDVVDACEPAGDPHDWKGWYRSLLLRDDAAIDQIWRKLRGLAKTLSGRGPRLATPSPLRSATFVIARPRCVTHLTTKRTCPSAAEPPRVRAGRCNSASSSPANRGKWDFVVSSRCEVSRYLIAGPPHGSLTPRSTARRCGSPHDQDRIRLALGAFQQNQADCSSWERDSPKSAGCELSSSSWEQDSSSLEQDFS
jgi:hypothetical protein